MGMFCKHRPSHHEATRQATPGGSTKYGEHLFIVFMNRTFYYPWGALFIIFGDFPPKGQKDNGSRVEYLSLGWRSKHSACLLVEFCTTRIQQTHQIAARMGWEG